jgi:hypothetical protein
MSCECPTEVGQIIEDNQGNKLIVTEINMGWITLARHYA